MRDVEFLNGSTRSAGKNNLSTCRQFISPCEPQEGSKLELEPTGG